MEFNDERLVPSCYGTNRELYYWHLSRYQYARGFIQRNDNVLDVACGTGYGAYELGVIARNVVGIDIDKETIDYAKNTYIAPNLSFLVGDCINLSSLFTNERFNICTSFETIEHLHQRNQELFVRVVSNYLTNDGLFILSTPNPLIYGTNENPFHLHELHLKEFRELLYKYFQQIYILGQRKFSGYNTKVNSFIARKCIASLYKLMFNSLKNVNKNVVQLADFEFSSLDVEQCLILVAVCRYPKI